MTGSEDTNEELRRAMISSVLYRYVGAPGFIIHHNQLGEKVVTIASRNCGDCMIINETLHNCIFKRRLIPTVFQRLGVDLSYCGFHVAGSTYEDDYLNIDIKMWTEGYISVNEEDLYPELLLRNGAVKTSEEGVCQTASGEYVTQTRCVECGKKTGKCRTSPLFSVILELKYRMDYCKKCALRDLDCIYCEKWGTCNKVGTPADCKDFEMRDEDYDFDDESICECPLSDD